MTMMIIIIKQMNKYSFNRTSHLFENTESRRAPIVQPGNPYNHKGLGTTCENDKSGHKA